MKNALRLLILAAAFGAFALPVLAQDAAAGAAASATDAQAKADMYQKFLALRKGGPAEQKQAYDVGKEYLSKYAATTDEDDKKIYEFIKNWVGKYEKAVVDFNFRTALFPAAGARPDYAKGYEIGRQMLSSDPENVAVLLDLSIAALANASDPKTANEAVSREAVQHVRRLTQLIESGKAPQRVGADGKTMAESWAPFPSRDEALGQLYYTHGLLVKNTSPDEAAQLFIKAARSNSTFKATPNTFYFLANAYLDGEYKRLINDYKTNYEGKEITEEMKPKYEELLARTNQVTDRIIDAWARAIALSSKPEQAKFKADLMNQLTEVYKQRHDGKVDGLPQLIAGVLQRPLPLPGDPLPTPPANTTGSTGSPAAGAAATTTATTPAAAKPATAGTKPRQ